MSVLQKDNYRLKALCRQDVESPNSLVNRINFALDSFDFAHAANEVTTDVGLAKYQVLLEAVYGYRKDEQDRLKRTTPSAGALYPTELLLLKHLAGQWQLLYYCFRQHRFFRVPQADVAQLVDDLGATPERAALLVYSDFGRTIQKYGVRAFRYLYLDAAFVLYNAWLLASTWKKDANLVLHFPKKTSGRYLPAPASNTLLLGLALDNDFDEVALDVAAVTPTFAPPVGPASAIAFPNAYNANLLRARSFHQRACADWQVHEQPLPYAGQQLHIEDVLQYLLNRRSVKSFADAAVAREQYKAVREDVLRYARGMHGLLGVEGFELACVPMHVTGAPARVEYLVSGTSRPVAAPDQAALRRQVVAACQDQVIMHNAAFLVVVLVNADKRSDLSRGYIDYVKSVLFGGLVCANLYQTGLFNKVGTTTIGGFSEKLLNQVLGQEALLPVVVQAFGVPDNSVAKYDNSTVVRAR